MDRAEFDKFAKEYRALHEANISASGESPEYFADYKIRDLKRLIVADGVRLEGCRILDFGAGVGSSTPFFRMHMPTVHVTNVDVSMESLKIGAGRFPADINCVAFDGDRLPFGDGTFDYVFVACVFHHIPAGDHRELFGEIRRVLRVGGQLMIFEHNPYNPLTVRAVNSCEFDENAVLLRARTLKTRLTAAGFRESRVRYRVFFPRMLRWLRALEDVLVWLPLGAQYYVRARK